MMSHIPTTSDSLDDMLPLLFSREMLAEMKSEEDAREIYHQKRIMRIYEKNQNQGTKKCERIGSVSESCDNKQDI